MTPPSFIKIIHTLLGSNSATISVILTKKSIIYYMVTLDGLLTLPSKQNILKQTFNTSVKSYGMLTAQIQSSNGSLGMQ